MYDPARDSWSDNSRNERDRDTATTASQGDEKTVNGSESSSRSDEIGDIATNQLTTEQETVDNVQAAVKEQSAGSPKSKKDEETTTGESNDTVQETVEETKQSEEIKAFDGTDKSKPAQTSSESPSLKRKKESISDQEEGKEEETKKVKRRELEEEPSQNKGVVTADEPVSPGSDQVSEKTEDVKEEEEPTTTEPIKKRKKPTSRISAEQRQAQDKLRERNQKKEPEAANDHLEKYVEAVRTHYNERPDPGMRQRKGSPIIKLRNFNNFIKSVLIQKQARPRSVVLDIGCGKGGDLLKWSKLRTQGWIGVDIADVSIQQARSRYEDMQFKPFWADFCVGDAFSDQIEDIVHPEAFPIDTVSIQFSLHYAFKSERNIRILLHNVSRALKRNGKFIGTIPNSDVLVKNIWSVPEGKTEWGNALYRVKFDKLPPKDLESDPFGHQYYFFLEDAVGNVPEYIVPFNVLHKLCSEYGLQLEYKRPFLDMFDSETSNDTRLFRLCDKMKVFKQDGSYGIDGDEREAAGFYLAFAFRKI